METPRRPQVLRVATSPPDWPCASTVANQSSPSMTVAVPITPPLTPSRSTQSVPESTECPTEPPRLALSGSGIDSTISGNHYLDFNVVETEPKAFPYLITDYSYNRKNKLGQGAWSDVYLADPSPSQATSSNVLGPKNGIEATPPLTPTKRERSAFPPVVPKAYAIKVPAMRSAKAVLESEARVLSYLSRDPRSRDHIVTFHGLDTRNGALVLKAMSKSLESWIDEDLNNATEFARSKMLADMFPRVAGRLLKGLSWLAWRGCTHGDIKPANILISFGSGSGSESESTTTAMEVVYTDFSSATLSHPARSSTPITAAQSGAGTWDYLSPTLLSSITPHKPSPETDLWSLAMTLLVLVLGRSPFSCAPSTTLKRDFIRKGNPLLYMTYGDDAASNRDRMNSLSQALGFNVRKWFECVLSSNRDVYVPSADEWRRELECGISL
ncbi:kinase-like protein [Aaosphaeria arxii CBS 175.79]|uniref:Autophagy-related protein 1 n=1 Tax=Aaosphaeria arxii CBS 175.79 TaxID=1450172 RepID=A0A6A5Y4V9_9PLEO|nr:kinase-like protein [Aaosphaeria arxii CBS 175.79]KAF2020299.1 kinase-like protein [Aaosphaeria arxii CBS 175.79]